MAAATPQDIWDLWDRKKAGSLPKEVVLKAIRSAGRKYLDKELTQAAASIPDPCPKDAFLSFMSSPYSPPSDDSLRQALKAFDGADSGKILMHELASLLQFLGEKMEADDAKRVVAAMGPTDEDGAVDIEVVIAKLKEPVQIVSPDIGSMLSTLPGV